MRLECLLAGTQYDLPVIEEAIEGALWVVTRKYAAAIKAQKEQMQAPSYGGYRNRHVRKIPPNQIRALGIKAFLNVLERRRQGKDKVVERLQRMLKSSNEVI